jgi:hypothetical protein
MNEIEQIRAFLNLAIDQELQATNEGDRPGAVWEELLEDAEYLDPEGDGAFPEDGELVLSDGRRFRISVEEV